VASGTASSNLLRNKKWTSGTGKVSSFNHNVTWRSAVSITHSSANDFFQLLEKETKDNRVVGKNIALSEEELLGWMKLQLLFRIMFPVS
jgi:hypothetical protein